MSELRELRELREEREQIGQRVNELEEILIEEHKSRVNDLLRKAEGEYEVPHQTLERTPLSDNYKIEIRHRSAVVAWHSVYYAEGLPLPLCDEREEVAEFLGVSEDEKDSLNREMKNDLREWVDSSVTLEVGQ